MSRHAAALNTVKSTPGATDDCLRCHSSDYAAIVRRNVSRAARGLPPNPLPSLAGGTGGMPQEGVGCGACHAPHNSNTPPLLRDTISRTCTGCHQDPDPIPAAGPHAPQENVIGAFGGLRVSNVAGQPTAALVGARSIHGQIDALGACSKCHGPNLRVPNPTPAQPNQTGHRFEISFDNCLPCHSPIDAEMLATGLRTLVESRLVALRQQADTLAAQPGLLGPQIARLNAARQNLALLEADASRGAHNGTYARALLDAAQDLLNAAANP